MNPTARDYLPLAIAALGLAALPSLMHAIGLGTSSATEIVVFAIACMALNVLVGTTGEGADEAFTFEGSARALTLPEIPDTPPVETVGGPVQDLAAD